VKFRWKKKNTYQEAGNQQGMKLLRVLGSKINEAPGKVNSYVELIKHGGLVLWKEMHAQGEVMRHTTIVCQGQMIKYI
jgi:hypothetical protein